ncbi:MAG: cytochrome c [Bradyrhizobium sp.]|uniref:c-type cytochrome n=1 Tax=Bradyrhizobium sp. TaxID=376 RepID=UPI0027303391|nr:cytochrome c [Bradyrhizobium sp.]MDP1869564.1 cytochrome c [Bradyrhizobium sp.]
MSRLAKLLFAVVLGGSLATTLLLEASAQQVAARSSGKLGLGRPALPEEIKAWDTDVRPDGKGLPVGKGTAKVGDVLFQERCASCHGEFGQGVGRYPAIAGGIGTLKADRPDKTVGSFWPDASTVFDYIKRSMPFGNAQSLTDDEAYSLTAYILSMNDVIKDENFELNEKNFASVKMPNAAAFYGDDRETAEKHFWKKDPCMKDCRTAPKVIGRAVSVDVTPDSKAGPKVD